MPPEIITIEKSYEQRLNEYMTILSVNGDLSASEIKNEWCFYIENVIEHGGWLAIWKISRQKCNEMQIKFPTFVFVMVKLVVFEELEAVVNIIAVKDDISLPESHHVPLINLYPTKQQENECFDIKHTVNCLDQLRIFYCHLWRPWDCDEENENWVSNNLKNRLLLYYDMKSGRLMHKTGRYIRSLLELAKLIEQKIKDLKDEIDENENDDSDADEDIVLRIVRLQLKREHVKSELEIYDNPTSRALIEKENLKVAEMRKSKDQQEAYLVWHGGTVEQNINFLHQVKTLLNPSSSSTVSYPLLETALDKAFCGDTVILCPGDHIITGSGSFEEGGCIKGLPDQLTKIVANDEKSIFLDWSGNVSLENLIIDGQIVDIAMSVRFGSLTMKNCKVEGNSKRSTGIIVFGHGNLIANCCEFVNLNTGLLIHSGANVILTDCSVSFCVTGIKVNAHSKLTANNCKIKDCFEYGILIDSPYTVENGDQAPQQLPLDSFQKMKEIKLENTICERNVKGNVVEEQEETKLYESDGEY